MTPDDLVKNDYLEECASLGYTPTQVDWTDFNAWRLPHMKKLIQEERLSAKRQRVSDPAIDGKTDDEIIKERLAETRDALLQDISHEVSSNAKLLNFHFPMSFYCGPVPLLSFNAHVKRTKHGAVILVYDELPNFLYNVLKVYALSNPIMAHSSYDESEDEGTMIEPILSREEAAKTLAKLTANFLHIGTSGPPPFGGQGGALSDVIIGHAISTIRFVIGHECGHIIGGHLSESASTMSPLQERMKEWLQERDDKKRNSIFSESFTEDEAYKIAQSWDHEKQADQYGMDLCLIPAWPMNGSIQRFHDAATRLTGPFIFFALENFITKAILSLLDGVDQLSVLRDHPPGTKRAEIMRGWVHQISVNAEILLNAGKLFTEWLEGIADDVYKRLR